MLKLDLSLGLVVLHELVEGHEIDVIKVIIVHGAVAHTVLSQLDQVKITPGCVYDAWTCSSPSRVRALDIRLLGRPRRRG